MVESDEEFAELCSKLLKRVKKSHHPSESQNAPKSSTAARGKAKKVKPSGTQKQKKDGGSRQSEVGAIAGPDGEAPKSTTAARGKVKPSGTQKQKKDGGSRQSEVGATAGPDCEAPKSTTAARGKVKPSGTQKQKKDGGSRQSEVGATAGPDCEAPKSTTAARGKVKPSGTQKQKKDGGSRQSEVGATAGPDNDKAEERNGPAQSCLTTGLLENGGSRADSREGGSRPPDPMTVKDLVLERMQQFKRAAPSRMKLESTESISEGHVGSSMACGSAQSDEALALALQMDVKEKPASLEDEGLFFCQLCQKDLTAMSGTLREQHVNRCLDQVESLGGSSAAPVVPGCPLCGKPFSTEKSRASHLKRCAAKLDVPAQTLLQAVQRQAVEAGAGVPPRAAGGKRKGVTKLKEPSKKRKVVQTGAEMEDLMVAMALSRSMQKDKNARNTAGAQPSLELPTQGKKSRRKQKDKPTPLLLVQAPEETVMKLQKRLSMLLTEEAVENKVMALPASHFWTMEEEERESWRLRGGKRCVLWDISNMTEKTDTLSYYTAELNPSITPWKSPLKKLHSSQTRVTTAILHSEKPQSQTAIDKDPQPASCEDKSPFSDSQKALLDLADLAGEGMTLTQWNGGNLNERTGRESPGSITSSGFIPAQEDKITNEGHGLANKIPLLVLSADFIEMVNNPHLSDAQLQTDCGEVLNAHMFVLYARCPLLVEAIHSEGFWVDESGMGRARRLLINDVSAEAALCFLRFLYAATTDFPSHCLPHVCELARRFGVKSLIDACELLVSGTHNTEGELSTEEEGDDGGERAETFQELLKSMWLNEGEDVFENVQADREDEEKLDDGGVGEGELEEIYEFALTQRKILAQQDSESESEQEVENPEKSDNNSPKSRNLSLEDKEKRDLMSTTSLKESPKKAKDKKCSPRKSLMCILSNSPEYSVISPIAASTEPKMQPSSSSSVTGASPVKKVSTSHNPSSSESPIPIISLISPNRDEDPEADMFASQSPPPLDDSYDRMFSQTCGEYGEPSDTGKSKSQINPVSPEQPILTSSPTAMPCPSLPELGSSPNIKPQTHSFLDGPSYSVECGKSLHSSLRDSHHSTPTQNSKDTSPKASSQNADIILILSSDEEMESDDQAAALTRSGQFDMPDIAKVIKESPVSFNQGRKSNEGFSHLEMSSSSEMSWLVPATPLPQNTSSKISLLQTSCLSQSPQSLQKTTHAAKSPPNSQKTCHPGRSSPNLQKMSHPGRSPPNSKMSFPGCSHPNSQKASHPSQSPPNLQKTSHPGRSPPNSQKTSHPGRSPLKAMKMSDPSWSPPKAMKMCDVAHASPNSQKTPSAAQSPETLQKTPPNSQQTPRSSPTSRNFDLDVSFQSCVSQTQASSVSLPLMSPKSPRTPRSLRPSVQEKLQTGLEAQPSVSSKTTSSPSISIASSTVFEVGDSEDEAPVAEPQANISNASFQFDYDEPPIPMEEDLWCNVLETPRKLCSPSTPRIPLLSNETPNKPLNCTPPIPSPAKSTTAASIEGSPQTTVHQSYLNSKLWEDWEDEDPELPAVLPLSQRLCKVPEVQKELRTPVSVVRRRELPPKVPITPLPDYSDMDTPVLKKELSKFGVRALPKKKMVLKLKEIFRYTHQVVNSDSEDDVPPSQPHGSVAQALQKPTGDKQQPQHTTKGSSSSHSGRKGPSVCTAPEVETEDDQPPTASQESTTSSMGASDTSSLSQSANTNEFETAFADEDDDELLPASQAASKEALTAEAVRRFIEAQPELHQQVLLYQPLDLAALHADLKQNGIRIAAGKLLDFLDSHCITFTTAAARKEKKSHRRRKAGKRY